jgi:hypothetical protein
MLSFHLGSSEVNPILGNGPTSMIACSISNWEHLILPLRNVKGLASTSCPLSHPLGVSSQIQHPMLAPLYKISDARSF